MSSPTPKRGENSFWRGDTLKGPYALVDDSTPPVPINITGWTFEWTFKRVGANESAADVEMTRTDDVNGTGTLEIVGFSALPSGSYSFAGLYTDTQGGKGYVCVELITIREPAP